MQHAVADPARGAGYNLQAASRLLLPAVSYLELAPSTSGLTLARVTVCPRELRDCVSVDAPLIHRARS